MAEAYYDDMSMIQSVKVSDIYRYTCNGGTGGTTEIRIKVQPWIGRRCLSVQPEESHRKMLYVQKQQPWERWETDGTRKLALYIPMNAMVRLTSAPEVVPAEEAEEYEMVDLRRDMILMCHDNRQHPSLGRTLQQLRELCYWSTMATKDGRDSVQKHMSMCEHCITRQMTDAWMAGWV